MADWFKNTIHGLLSNAIYALLIIVGGAIAVWLAKLTPVVKSFAPMSYFFAFFGALVVLLAVANLGVALWHRFKPPAPPAAGPSSLPALDHTEIDQLRSDVEQHSRDLDKAREAVEAISKFQAETNKSVLGFISDLNERLTKHQEQMSECYSAQDKARIDGQKALYQEIEVLRQGCATLAEEVTDHRKRATDALHTIWLREKMAQDQVEIRRAAAELYDPLAAGECYDEKKWQDWERAHRQWATKLEDWVSRAVWFVSDASDRTLKFDDSKYKGKWDVRREQFPDDEAMRVFKKFRIIQQQWELIVLEVAGGMHQVAFLGQTQQEVRNGQRPG